MRNPRRFSVTAVAFFVCSIAGYSGAQTVRCTTWNLEWFPNGSPKEASAAQQDQRFKQAADVLRPINPDIILLQEVRDYDVCARLGEALTSWTTPFAIRPSVLNNNESLTSVLQQRAAGRVHSNSASRIHNGQSTVTLVAHEVSIEGYHR